MTEHAIDNTAPIFNVYCDESCHLENDGKSAMVIGAIWCPLEHVRQISHALRDILQRHGLSHDFEVKWTKVSPAKVEFYLNWMRYFFDTVALHFRALIIPDKTKLNHAAFPEQDHDALADCRRPRRLRGGPTSGGRLFESLPAGHSGGIDLLARRAPGLDAYRAGCGGVAFPLGYGEAKDMEALYPGGVCRAAPGDVSDSACRHAHRVGGFFHLGNHPAMAHIETVGPKAGRPAHLVKADCLQCGVRWSSR